MYAIKSTSFGKEYGIKCDVIGNNMGTTWEDTLKEWKNNL